MQKARMCGRWRSAPTKPSHDSPNKPGQPWQRRQHTRQEGNYARGTGLHTIVKYQEDAGELGEPGRACEQIDWERVRPTIFAQSQKKAPEPDKPGMPVVRLWWLWDPLG